MAKQKTLVAFDVTALPAYDNAKEVTKSTTAKTAAGSYEPVTGLRGQVFQAKITEVEAETVAEAIKIVEEAYGHGGGAAQATNNVWAVTKTGASKGEFEWKAE